LNELMNIKEAAEYLRLNHGTVYKLAQQRRIPAFKVGGNWRFDRLMLQNWLMEKTRMEKGWVMIVDDDPIVQELLKEMVMKQGFQVMAAGNGETALDEIGKRHFDLLFLDLKIPGLNGLDILKAIKEKARDIVIVVVTGYADEPIALKAMALGPLMLVHKPFREADIKEVLNIVMQGKMV
jgi:excisionase family DNA binding protein